MNRICLLALALASCATQVPAPAPARVDPLVEPILIALNLPSVVPLKYASAEDVVKTLNDLVNASARATAQRVSSNGSCVLFVPGASPPKIEPPMVILADPRTNSVVVQAPPDDFSRILDLIAKLDTKVQ